MQCQLKDELERHLSDIRRLGARPDLTSEQSEAAARAERFAIGLLKNHDTAGHEGKRCPEATQFLFLVKDVCRQFPARAPARFRLRDLRKNLVAADSR